MNKIAIDIIILSYAKDEHLKGLTIQTIATLFASEDPGKIHFNVVVLESDKTLAPYQYPNSTTIYPVEKFGFHKYLNMGIRATNNPYVCLCNNDLIFHKNWASEIIKAMDSDTTLLSAAPSLPNSTITELPEDESQLDGYFGILFGWCIFVKRDIFNIIGLLDENLTFWYSDHDYIRTLKKHGLKNRLITNSIVSHIGSGSWNAMTTKQYIDLTQLPRLYYNYKWFHKSFIRYKIEIALFKIKKMSGLLNR